MSLSSFARFAPVILSEAKDLNQIPHASLPVHFVSSVMNISGIACRTFDFVSQRERF